MLPVKSTATMKFSSSPLCTNCKKEALRWKEAWSTVSESEGVSEIDCSTDCMSLRSELLWEPRSVWRPLGLKRKTSSSSGRSCA